MAGAKKRTELDIDPSTLPELDEAPDTSSSETEQTAPETDEDKKPGKKKLAIMASIGLGAIFLVAAIGWTVMSYIGGEPSGDEAVIEEKKTIVPKTLHPPARINVQPIFEFKKFLVNISDKKHSSTVEIHFAAVMNESSVTNEISRNITLIREAIFMLLQSKALNDFRDNKKLKRIAVEAAIEINQSIQSGAVTKVLVTKLTII